MVKMAMSVDDINAAKFILGEGDKDPIDITSRIDDGCFSGSLTTQNVTIRLNGPDNQCSENQISPSRIILL
jgi:hypothetical protein